VLSRERSSLAVNERGVSLVELLVGLVVGSLIVAGAITVFAKISFSGLENVRMVRLNEQLRSTLGTIRREIQRAGYVDAWPAGATEIGDLLSDQMSSFGFIQLGGNCADSDGDGADECDCITYSYDVLEDGDYGFTDMFAFQLNDSAVERDTNMAVCPGGVMLGSGWQAITDDEVIIDVLTFELDPDSTIVELNDGVGNDDGTCESGEACLARRKINVVLEGSLAADSDFTIHLRDEIKVKNDHYYTMP